MPAAAIESFRHALSLRPDYVPAHNNLGNLLREQGRFVESVACFRAVIGLSPDYAEGHNNLANVLVDLGELESAIDHYRRAIALRPDLLEARSNLLFILSYRERFDAADYLREVRDFGRVAAERATPWQDWHVPLTVRRQQPFRVGFVSGT